MKVILTGSTGFIGNAVLNRALKNPAITSLVALSRRDLPEAAAENPKLTVVIVGDFNVYPDSVLQQLRGADACIWSMGTYNWDPVVELEYPEAFQQALLKVLDGTKAFRYVYLGGAFTETDQEKSLWFLAKGRHIRGLAQTKVLEFAAKNENLEPYVVKPAGVVSSTWAWMGCLLPTVWVDELATVMVDLAASGGSEQVVSNKSIIQRGKEELHKVGFLHGQT